MAERCGHRRLMRDCASCVALLAYLDQHFAELRDGKCPTCHQAVTQKQVGHCVYGSCGHRLYQGRLKAMTRGPA